MRLLKQAFRCGVMLLGTLACPMFSYCNLYPIPDIAKLTNSSPVIVVGEVLSIVRVGNGEIPMPDGKQYTCEEMAAFIRVDEVLKGESANGMIQVGYLHNSSWEGGPLTNGLAEGAYRMFFLKPDGDKFAFAAPQQSSMAMSRSRSALSANSDGEVYTQVLRHLAEGLFAKEDPSQDRIQSIFVVDHESSPIVTELYKLALDGAVASSNRAFRGELLAALVRRKDVTVLPDLETALLTNHDDVAQNSARGNMILALQEIDPSLSGPILIRALRLPEAGMRIAAVEALKSAPSEEGIEALFGVLDDPDPEVQFQAIETLSVLLQKPYCARYPTAEDGAFRACAEGWRKFATTWKFRSN